MVGEQGPLTNQAKTFLACKGSETGRPVLELRFLVAPIGGFNPAAISKSGMLTIGDNKSPVSLDIFPVQTMTMFVVSLSLDEAKDIASLKINQRANLYLYFQMAAQRGFFVTLLMDPTGPVSTVLTACHVAIPAPPQIPMNAVTPAMKKFTFQGIQLGMTAQQALAAEKAITTTPIKPSPGGGVDFETSQFYFISVSADNNGLIEFYKVCGKPSRATKSGPRSGPLYDAAVKAFGPATGKPPGTQTWVQWDKSGGVDARYEWDGDEEPGGCLYVTKTAQ